MNWGVSYPSLILAYIKEYLEEQGFRRDMESECCGFHTTARGSRLQVEGPDGNTYEVLVNPIRKGGNK